MCDGKDTSRISIAVDRIDVLEIASLQGTASFGPLATMADITLSFTAARNCFFGVLNTICTL